MKTKTGIKTVRVEYDPDPECPMDLDSQWKLISFNRGSIHYQNPDNFVTVKNGRLTLKSIGLRRKLDVGLLFLLDYYEHGPGMYSLSGEGMQCRWDTANYAGVLVWEHPAKEMGAKTREDRARDARAFLEEYNAWMNGWVYYFSVEDEDGEVVDSCGGFADGKYMTSVINEILKPGDRVRVTGQCAGVIDEGELNAEIVGG